MSEKWLTTKVVENRHWTDTLFSLRADGAKLNFQAGQFVRIALDIEGQRVARAFSFVNPPQDPTLEFYGVVVPEGPLSPRLAKLRAGDSLYVAGNPAGFLVLREVPDAETLWLISTGTGLAPFLSILRTDAPWQRFKNIVVVHAVRHEGARTLQDVLLRRLTVGLSATRGREGAEAVAALVARLLDWDAARERAELEALDEQLALGAAPVLSLLAAGTEPVSMAAG